MGKETPAITAKQRQHRLTAIFDSIKKYASEISSQKQPWHILLGSAHSGRQTLLHRLSDSWQQFSFDDHATFWVNANHVFLQPSAKALKFNISSRELFWDPLSTWLRKHRGKQAFEHSFIMLPMPDIYDKSDAKLGQLSSQLNRQLKWLQKSTPNTQTGLILSQSDQLPGFNEYALHCDQHQQQAPFGFTIEPKQKPLDQCMILYDLLIQSTTNRIFLITQQCKASEKKIIEQFPLQLHYIKQQSFSLLSKINHINQLSGIHLISCLQQEPTNNTVTNVVINASEKISEHSYFISDLFDVKPAPKKTRAKVKIDNKSSRIIGGIILFLVIVFAWIHHEANRFREPYSTEQQQTTSMNLSQLNYLNNQLQHEHSWWNIGSRWFNHKKYLQRIEQSESQYQSLLKSQLIPALTEQITQVFQDPHSSFISKWSSLKLYQMLLQPQHRNAAFIATWLQTTHLDKQPYYSNLQLHLQHLFQDQSIAASPDTTLLTLASSVLGGSGMTTVIYAELKQSWGKHQQAAFPHLYTSPNISWPNPSIDDAMRHDQVSKTINKDIPNEVDQFFKNTWILNRTSITPPNQKTFGIELQILYLSDYHNTWDQIIHGIKIDPDSKTKWDRTWKDLANTHGNFWKNVAFVADQIKPEPNTVNFNKTVSKYFDDLNPI